MSIKKATKKIKVLDLFAGAGGFGLGFNLSNKNYQLIASLEMDKWAVETLEANNNEGQKIIHADIRDFDTDEKIKKICPVKPDVIIGGPPCQGFSNASGKKDPSDPRNSLFKNYAQWVEVLEPKIFVMENVRGLLNGVNVQGERVIDIIKKTFEDIGYRIDIWQLNAANFGVPQSRERIFIVGNKLKKSIEPPTKTHYLPNEIKSINGKAKIMKSAITVAAAIGDLPELYAGEGEEEIVFKNKGRTDFQKQLRGNLNILYNHVTMNHTKRLVDRYKFIQEGKTMDELPDSLKVKKRSGNGELSNVEFSSNYRHLKPDMVSYTIPASFYSNFIHPFQPRNITSREAARLQSFPDYYIFKGKRTQMSSKLLKKLGKHEENHLSQYNQIGNAVPPLLAKAVAEKIYSFLLHSYEFLIPQISTAPSNQIGRAHV